MKIIPKRIVLSRKGFDKSAGGFASPIFSDGRMVSLPIPENAKYPSVTLRFNDLGSSDDRGAGISSIIDRLPRPFDVSSKVHLDPDLRPALRPKNGDDPLGYFGQESRAMTELQSHGVCDPSNDSLFLFYGWFKGVREEHDGRLRYHSARRGELQTHSQHVIWGWLQIEEKPKWIPTGELDPSLLHIDYHPHIEGRARRKNNYIFKGRERLSFVENVAGAGVFSHLDRDLRLTCENEINKRSSWVVPPFLRSCARGRIAKGRWTTDGSVHRVEYSGFGQEFIFDTEGHEEAASQWLATIFTKLQS